MSWGKSIVVAFIAFAAFIGTLAGICFRQNINLVSKDYYQEELNYQDEIEEIRNVTMLSNKPGIAVTQKTLNIHDLPKSVHVQLKILRPSDPRFDAIFEIDSARTIDMSQYPSGKYNASIRWNADGKNYLLRESITL